MPNTEGEGEGGGKQEGKTLQTGRHWRRLPKGKRYICRIHSSFRVFLLNRLKLLVRSLFGLILIYFLGNISKEKSGENLKKTLLEVFIQKY